MKKTQTKTKKNYIELRIPKPSKTFKTVLRIFALSLASFGTVLFLLKFLVPIVLNIFQVLVLLVNLYIANLDNINIKFFGGLAFLFIGWKFFEALAIMWMRIMELIVKEIEK